MKGCYQTWIRLLVVHPHADLLSLCLCLTIISEAIPTKIRNSEITWTFSHWHYELFNFSDGDENFKIILI